MNGQDHWSKVASRWRHVGPPLKPTDEELGFYKEGIELWRGDAPARAVILGVTQELFHLDWPKGTSIRSVDHSIEMIEKVWPGSAEDAICADWRDMPLADGSVDVAVSDGGLSMLSDTGIQSLIRELRRVLSSGAVCVFRAYVPPEVQEEPGDVFQALVEGEIEDLSALKFRLWMAMQASPASGVPLGEIWRALHEFAPDFETLRRKRAST